MNTLARNLVRLSSLPLAVSKRRLLWPILVVFLLAITSMAQERPQATTGAESQPRVQSPSQAPAENAAPDEGRVTLPAGTRVALVLTHPIDSKSTHRGDEIYAVTTAPVTLDSRVAMPAGTYVQGKVEKLTRHGTRAEIVMRSVAIIFPDGYVANIGGPMTIESEEGTAWINPGTGTKAGVVAAPLLLMRPTMRRTRRRTCRTRASRAMLPRGRGRASGIPRGRAASGGGFGSFSSRSGRCWCYS